MPSTQQYCCSHAWRDVVIVADMTSRFSITASHALQTRLPRPSSWTRVSTHRSTGHIRRTRTDSINIRAVKRARTPISTNKLHRVLQRRPSAAAAQSFGGCASVEIDKAIQSKFRYAAVRGASASCRVSEPCELSACVVLVDECVCTVETNSSVKCFAMRFG